MKTRTGFVSNSSSSSFIITTKEPLSKSNLLDIFNVPILSPLYPFAKDMAEWFYNNSELINVKKYIEEHCFDDDEELPPIIMDAITNKKLIYAGSAADDCEAVEAAICDMTIKYISADFSIEKEGSY